MLLNYRHLRYFRAVARDGVLSRAAQTLNLSQSALSAQIRTLEDSLGHRLFDRVGRRLELTEVGRIALDYADRIFETGDELVATLSGAGAARAPLRVGALSTLSRNFQIGFLRPLLGRSDVELILRSGDEATLLDELAALALDIVLTTELPSHGSGSYVAERIADQPVGLHGTPARVGYGSLAEVLSAEPVILPTERSIRIGFEALVEKLGVNPRIAAVADDMAMIRLLAREDAGLAVAPAVVLADEIAAGTLATAPFPLDIVERFYAITARRSFPHPLIGELLGRAAAVPD
ncbi:MAG: LysR family transcriptional regulator [Pseudomonadota bacterium]